MTLDTLSFIQDIVERVRFDLPCIIMASAYATTSAAPNDHILYGTVRKQWIKKTRTSYGTCFSMFAALNTILTPLQR